MPTRPAYALPDGRMPLRGARPEPLRRDESRTVLSQLNGNRTALPGINSRPIPQGQISVRPDGGLSVEASRGRHYAVQPNGTLASFASKSHSATFRPDGHIATLRTPTLHISRAPDGARMVVRQAPHQAVVVSSGPRYGYVQRPVVVHNATYVQRTYVVDNHVYYRSYRPYRYGGSVIYSYAPTVYYSPSYYYWTYYQPWTQPVVYPWGWMNDPWYGYYGYYWTPLVHYPAPWWWLTDYMVAESLREAWYARAAEPTYYYEQPQAAPITPEVRQAIAEEVQRELAEQQQQATAYAQPGYVAPQEEIPSFLQPGRIFVVSTPVDVLVGEERCALSQGDVLRLEAAPQPGEMAATVRVLSSKTFDCQAGSMPMLSISDLQEMQNSMREKLDSGLNQMRTNQSAGALPPAPEDAWSTYPGPGSAIPASNDDAAALIAQAQQNADQAEAELWREAGEQ